MALLTISKESTLNGSRSLRAYVKRVSRVSRECLLVRVHVTRHSSFTSAEIWRSYSKWRMVIVGAEFGNKQSHDPGPNVIKPLSRKYCLTNFFAKQQMSEAPVSN